MSVNIRGLNSLGFSYFYYIQAPCLCQSVRQGRQNLLQIFLSHQPTHHSPASSTFEARRMEHAQQRPVNKSLVEPFRAVVKPCTDPESEQAGRLSCYRILKEKRNAKRTICCIHTFYTPVLT